MVDKSEKFWLDDPTVLYKNNAYLKIIPVRDMTTEEQYNALTRLYIILIVLAWLFDSNEKWWIIPVILLMVTAVLYNINNYLQKGDDISNQIDGDADMADMDTFSVIKNIDSNSLGFGSHISSLDFNDTNTICSDDMNSIYSYNSIDSVASNSNNSEIGDGHINYNPDLFKSIEDQWDSKITERNQMTQLNTTVPNNQVEFAKWAFSTPPTCKEDTANCHRFEDLRYKR